MDLKKPAKGTALLERRSNRAKAKTFEASEKAKVRKRDRGCRWPGCDCRKQNIRTEVAHLHAKGSGGDHGVRSTADQMIELCVLRHQGSPSLHSGDLKIEPQTAVGTDGPCDFFARNEAGVFEMVAHERSVGLSTTRGGW